MKIEARNFSLKSKFSSFAFKNINLSTLIPNVELNIKIVKKRYKINPIKKDIFGYDVIINGGLKEAKRKTKNPIIKAASINPAITIRP